MAGFGGTRVHSSLRKTGSKRDKAQDAGLGKRLGKTLRAQEGKGMQGLRGRAGARTPAVNERPPPGLEGQ